MIFEFGMKGGSTNSKQQTPENDNKPQEMTLAEAYGFKTKKGKPFGSLTIDQLEYIIDHGGAQSSMAAHLIKEDKENNPDLQPLPEEDDLLF